LSLDDDEEDEHDEQPQPTQPQQQQQSRAKMHVDVDVDREEEVDVDDCDGVECVEGSLDDDEMEEMGVKKKWAEAEAGEHNGRGRRKVVVQGLGTAAEAQLLASFGWTEHSRHQFSGEITPEEVAQAQAQLAAARLQQQ
jgi:hypothetical protein